MSETDTIEVESLTLERYKADWPPDDDRWVIVWCEYRGKWFWSDAYFRASQGGWITHSSFVSASMIRFWADVPELGDRWGGREA